MFKALAAALLPAVSANKDNFCCSRAVAGRRRRRCAGPLVYFTVLMAMGKRRAALRRALGLFYDLDGNGEAQGGVAQGPLFILRS